MKVEVEIPDAAIAEIVRYVGNEAFKIDVEYRQGRGRTVLRGAGGQELAAFIAERAKDELAKFDFRAMIDEFVEKSAGPILEAVISEELKVMARKAARAALKEQVGGAS